MSDLSLDSPIEQGFVTVHGTNANHAPLWLYSSGNLLVKRRLSVSALSMRQGPAFLAQQ